MKPVMQLGREGRSTRKKSEMRNAASMLALAACLSGAASGAHAVPAVFFNEDLAAGEQTFVNVAAAADAAYNAAHPGASQSSIVFRVDITSSSTDVFTATDGSTTVWVKTTRGGQRAMNDETGDESNDGFTNWRVDYTPGDWAEAVAGGYTISFFSDSSLLTPYMINAVGLNVSDWGTCCTNNGTKPDGTIAGASQIYMLFDGSVPLLVGGIDTAISGEEHFVAAIDDRNSFSSVTLVPNGIGEAFGAGGILTFSTLQLNSVPAGSSVVTVGTPPDPEPEPEPEPSAPPPPPPPPPPPNIDAGAGPYTVDQLNRGEVNPVFEGGTLAVGDDGVVNAPVSMRSGGTIDTEGHNATFAGNITDETGGGGALIKSGDGVLELAGANTFAGGLIIRQGVLRAGHGGAVGSGGIEIGGGALQAGGDIALSNTIILSDPNAAVDTDGHTLVLTGSLSGNQILNKTGAGVLVLTGDNSHGGVDVREGGVFVRSQGALGASDGVITLHENTLFMTGSDMTLSQGLHIAGPNAAFDTGAHDVTVTGAVTGEDCLNKVGTGRMNLVAAASNAIGACVQQGLLSFNNTFTGNVWVFTNGVAGGSGRIDGDMEVRGVLAPGNSPGRLEVAGSVNQLAGSTLAVEIDGRNVGVGAGAYDTLLVGGVYTAGGTLAPQLRGISGAATNTFTPELGDVFQIVTAAAGVTGAYAALAQPTSGLAANTRFEVRYTPNAVLLGLTAESYAALLSGQATQNAVAAAGAVDQLRGPADAPAGTGGAIAEGLFGLNAAGAARALTQAAGEVHADSLDSALQSFRLRRGAVTDRLNGGLATAAGAVGGEPTVGRHMWGAVVDDVTHVGGDAYADAYRVGSTSIIFGYDREVRPGLVLGLAAAYGDTSTRSNGLGTAKADSYQGMVYGQWAARGLYVNGVAAASRDRYDLDRQVALSTGVQALHSSPDGYSLGLDLEAGRKLAVGPATLTPAAGLAYDRVHREGLVESGADGVALRLSADDRDALAARIGARLAAAFEVNGLRIQPYGSAFYARELGDKVTKTAPTLNGVQLAVRAANAGTDGVRGDVGLDVQMSNAVSLNVAYRYGDSDNARSNAVSGRLAVRW